MHNVFKLIYCSKRIRVLGIVSCKNAPFLHNAIHIIDQYFWFHFQPASCVFTLKPVNQTRTQQLSVGRQLFCFAATNFVRWKMKLLRYVLMRSVTKPKTPLHIPFGSTLFLESGTFEEGLLFSAISQNRLQSDMTHFDITQFTDTLLLRFFHLK